LKAVNLLEIIMHTFNLGILPILMTVHGRSWKNPLKGSDRELVLNGQKLI